MPKEFDSPTKASREAAVKKSSKYPEDSPKSLGGGICDLHTSVGKVTFVLIVAAIAVLIQILPRDLGQNTQIPAPLPQQCQNPTKSSPTYIIYNPRSERDDHLVHVKDVLEHLGFRQSPNDTKDWDLMWAHEYPFFKLPSLRQLKDHQVVNHFPGSGYVTNKVDLALTDSSYIPRAFRLPKDVAKFQEYAEKFPDKEFVQKNNKHRHIYLRTIPELDVGDSETFIQEYMTNPLLVDGKKFDIGAYTVITSIDPLRMYVYHGDYLLRFCPVVYYPFDRANLDKYVVGDDYTPTWEMPSLKEFTSLGFSMKDSLDAHLRRVGQDPSVIWAQIHDSIREVMVRKEGLLKDALQRFKSRRNFFELMRFDFILDEQLRVFLLEANMSPNLSSAHFKPNQLLYEQVLYNTFKLVGIGDVQRTQPMVSAFKNIAVDANQCTTDECRESCKGSKCRFCRQCLTKDNLAILHAAHREHMNRGNMLRILPASEAAEDDTLTPKNVFMSLWFSKKCQTDPTYC